MRATPRKEASRSDPLSRSEFIQAAHACKLLGVGRAISVHYAHPLVLGPQCGDLFRAAVGRVSPQTAVTLLRPDATKTLQIATNDNKR